jgi:murein DD-endopeptidase MepM/ murein hydrolase activator NlpD
MSDLIGNIRDVVDIVRPSQSRGKKLSPEQALREFEGMVLRLLLKEVRQSMSGEGLFGQEGAMYQDLFDEEITNRISEMGGLGLSSRLDLSAFSQGASVGREEIRQALFPVDGIVSSEFGWREGLDGGPSRMHHGVDIAAAEGAPVLAALPGTVTFAGVRGNYGNLVIVDHGDGLETRYAHCQSLMVAEGDPVSAGTPIGSVGSTGRSTGPHLHFEVRLDSQPVEPSGVLRWAREP